MTINYISSSVQFVRPSAEILSLNEYKPPQQALATAKNTLIFGK